MGATHAETTEPLAGDELVAEPDLTATRAITIHAGVDAVWPWIVQLGQGRGGFYSHDSLENLIGCDIHSALQINPDWQHLDVGDAVRLAPELALTVAVAKPPRTLVLKGGALPGTTIAVYLGRWLDDARKLAERIAAQPPRPVWLFSGGPIGDPPKPAEEPAEIRDQRLCASAATTTRVKGMPDSAGSQPPMPARSRSCCTYARRISRARTARSTRRSRRDSTG
ncbi:hypothetical protein [Actinoplanes sp. NPDC089786]|uniref:hypothetical protein n=1 Tax=Actinoplanes sp. NPDC089786 TaxID=3155185 RepID=UPI00342B31D7